jgi:hypothetical protein
MEARMINQLTSGGNSSRLAYQLIAIPARNAFGLCEILHHSRSPQLRHSSLVAIPTRRLPGSCYLRRVRCGQNDKTRTRRLRANVFKRLVRKTPCHSLVTVWQG